jgi:hypothetical protein
MNRRVTVVLKLKESMDSLDKANTANIDTPNDIAPN